MPLWSKRASSTCRCAVQRIRRQFLDREANRFAAVPNADGNPTRFFLRIMAGNISAAVSWLKERMVSDLHSFQLFV